MNLVLWPSLSDEAAGGLLYSMESFSSCFIGIGRDMFISFLIVELLVWILECQLLSLSRGICYIFVLYPSISPLLEENGVSCHIDVPPSLCWCMVGALVNVWSSCCIVVRILGVQRQCHWNNSVLHAPDCSGVVCSLPLSLGCETSSLFSVVGFMSFVLCQRFMPNPVHHRHPHLSIESCCLHCL